MNQVISVLLIIFSARLITFIVLILIPFDIINAFQNWIRNKVEGKVNEHMEDIHNNNYAAANKIINSQHRNAAKAKRHSCKLQEYKHQVRETDKD